MTWSSEDVKELLTYLGYTKDRTSPELIYEKNGVAKHVTVPPNRKDLAVGTLGSIFRQIGISKRDAEMMRRKKFKK